MNNTGLSRKTKKIIAISLIALFIILIAVIIIASYNRSQTAQVSLQFPSGSGKPTVLFNNRSIKSIKNNVYDLRKGNYTLTVTDSGYKKFSVNFTLKPQQNIYVNVNLIPLTKPAATELNKVAATVYGNPSTTAPLTSFWPNAVSTAVYFDNNTWAFVTVDTNVGLGLAYLIEDYDSSTGSWVVAGGPYDDSGDFGNISGLPSDLQSYLMTNFGNHGG